MHEHSLVRSLLRHVESIAACRPDQVREIEVAIGPLSGVEPMLVESAFALLAPQSRFSTATLRVEETDLTAQCRECSHPFVVEGFHFQCPQCWGRLVDVIGGDDFRLISVSVEEDSVPTEPPPRSHQGSEIAVPPKLNQP